MTDFLLASGQAVNAATAYQMLVGAVHARPADAEAWYRLGCLLNDVKKPLAAAAAFARSDGLRPRDFKTLTNWGWNLHLAGRSEEAERPLRAAIEAEETAANAWANLAQVWGLTGRQDAGIAAGRKAVEHGGQALHHMALAFQLFFAGEWAEGFREYEHRFAFRMPDALNFPYPLWRGERVKTLFVTGEQGLGDSVFGMRWLPGLCGRAERVIVHVHRELLSLQREHLPAQWEVEAIPHPLPEADAWVALMSLPVALGLTDFSLDAPYIRLPMLRRSELPPSGIRRVGIVWAGAPNGEDAAIKAIPFADMLRLCELPGLEIHSLQVGEAASAIGDHGAHGLLRDRSPEISNMADTARIMAALDLVISADTAAAHLAGAMGKPVWLLLNSRGGDGRWGRTGERTNWYRSMRVWRRGLNEQWSDVLRRVCEELR